MPYEIGEHVAAIARADLRKLQSTLKKAQKGANPDDVEYLEKLLLQVEPIFVSEAIERSESIALDSDE